MKRRRVIKAVAWLAVLVLLAGAGAFFYDRLPEATAQFPLPGLQVTLINLSDGTQTMPGDQVPLAISVLSDRPIAKIELYADGLLVESQAYTLPSVSSIQMNWGWSSQAPGPHILVARAADSQGQIGQSPPLLINALYEPPKEPYMPLEGETLESVALLLHTDPASLGDANPSVDPTAPLPAGQQVQLPVSGESSQPPSSPPPPSAQEPGDPPGKLEVVFSDIASLITGDFPPAPPQLAIATKDCQVKLVISPLSDDALGYTVFGFQVATQNFGKLADIGPGQDPLAPIAWLDPYPPLTHFQYFVIAFNAAGSTPSNFVSIASVAKSLDEAGCFGNEGDGLIIQGQLLTADFSSAIPVEQSYCYFSKGDGSWFRYPENEFQFFQQGPLTGLEAFFIPSSWPFPSNQEPIQLMAECWGWQGGALQYLGMARTSVPPNPVNPRAVLEGQNFTLAGPSLGVAKGDPYIPPWFGKKIPPPHNLRLGTQVLCQEHGGYKVSPSPCDPQYEVSSWGFKLPYTILIWDWKPEFCLPGASCKWYNQIEGFRIYSAKQYNGWSQYTLLVDVPPNATAAAIPPGDSDGWMGTSTDCYVVRAYAGNIESDYAKFCPYYNYSKPKKIILEPSQVITTARIVKNGACGSVNYAKNLDAGEAAVGIYSSKSPLCTSDQHTYDAGIRFELTDAFPPGQNISVNAAYLWFDPGELIYSSSTSVYDPHWCARNIGYELLPWEDWDPAAAAAGQTPMLGDFPNAIDIFDYPYDGIDVTGVVLYWLHNPNKNHGFALWTNAGDLKNLKLNPTSQTYYCISKLNGFQLEIQYYVIP